MAEQPARVVRLDLWIDPVFDRILRDAPGLALAVMKLNAPRSENMDLLRGARFYHISAAKDEVPLQWQVTRDLLDQCPDLACVSTSGAGYDTVDVAACTDAGVLVVNQAGGNANSVAEHALGLMLAVSRRVLESASRLRNDCGFSREDLMGHELSDKTLGLVGLGHIGQRTAQLGAAFNMHVVAHDPYLKPDEITARGAQPVSLEELLAASDFVSLHCPLTSETRGMFDALAFARMKQGAIFITTARGGIHQEAALYDALLAGHLAGAGLDVWDVEPPARENPLLALSNVVPTFHTAGVTHEARRNVARMAAEQLVALAEGRQAARVVNPLAWQRAAQRLHG